MAMISDVQYTLHALRLTHLRYNSSPTSSTTTAPSTLTPSQRLISLSPTSLSSNPYVRATDLGDVDTWPEIGYALDSPVLEGVRDGGLSSDEEDGEGFVLDRSGSGKLSSAGNGSGVGQSGGPRLTPSRSYIRRALETPNSTPLQSKPLGPTTTPDLLLTARKPPTRTQSNDTSPQRTPAASLQQQQRGGGGDQIRDDGVSLRYSQTIGRQSNLGMGGIRINGNGRDNTNLITDGLGTLQSQAQSQAGIGFPSGPPSNHTTPTATSSRLTFSPLGSPSLHSAASSGHTARPTTLGNRSVSSTRSVSGGSSGTPSTLRERSRSNTLQGLVIAGVVGSPSGLGGPTHTPTQRSNSGSGSNLGLGSHNDKTPTGRTLSDLSTGRPHTVHLSTSNSHQNGDHPGFGERTSPRLPSSPSSPSFASFSSSVVHTANTTTTTTPPLGPPIGLSSFFTSTTPATSTSTFQTTSSTAMTRTGSGLQAQISNLRTRARRPRADSAPVVVISSPGREGEKERERERERDPEREGETQGERVGILQGPMHTSPQRQADDVDESSGRRMSSFAVPRPSSKLIRGLANDTEDQPPIIGSVRDFFRPTGANRQSLRVGGLTGGSVLSGIPDDLGGFGGSVLGRAMLAESMGGGDETGAFDFGSPGAMGVRKGGLLGVGAGGESDTDGGNSDYRSMDEDEDDEDEFGEATGGNDFSGRGGTGYVSLGGSGLETAMGSVADPILEVSSVRRNSMATLDTDKSVVPNMTFDKRDIQNSTGTRDRTSRAPRKETSELSKLFRPASALSFASNQSSTTNPFLGQYASIPPPQGSSIPSLQLVIFFPHSNKPSTPIKLTVRKDVSVEEVIGWACAQYWDEGRKPGLEDGHERGENRDMDTGVWTSTVGWALRIVEDEDDGEVDEDFPALDREGQIAKFAFNAFAVVEASNAQIRQNLAKQPLRPTLTPQLTGRSTRANSLGAGASLAVSSTSTMPADRAQAGSLIGASTYTAGSRATTMGPNNPLSSGLGISSATQMAGVMVLLRIKIASSASHQGVTTINVPSDMYFADIIELLVKKRQLDPPISSEWRLILADMTMALPLDRTVESLMGNVELALVRKQWAERHKLLDMAKIGERRGGDPSTSIFKRPVETSRMPGIGSPASSYRKFIVQRKMPIGRHERILAIDGDYIHIMPTDNKTFFDSMKTSSFHITAVDSCKQNVKSPTNIKIMVVREGAMKRYDFETENAGQATEIVSALKTLMKIYQADKVPVPAPSARRIKRS